MNPDTLSVTIYTDGGCDPNPGPGGWAALLLSGDHRKELSGGLIDTTNNQMELTAAIRALEAIKKPSRVTLVTDSQYLRMGITQWITNWKRNGWKTSNKTPVKNRDLWEALDGLTRQHKITWKWVKGHAGQPENERVDQLATEARLKIMASPPDSGESS